MGNVNERSNNSQIATSVTYKCNVCHYQNKSNKAIETCAKCSVSIIKIPIKISQFSATLNNQTFSILLSYTSSNTINDIIKKAEKFINHKFQPKSYYIYYIKKESFCGGNIHESSKNDWNNLCSKSITEFTISDITQIGLEIYASNAYRHIIQNDQNLITCEHIQKFTKNNSLNPLDLALKCPIYNAAKTKYAYGEDIWEHLFTFTHFTNESCDKPRCRYNQKCKSFCRLSRGSNLLKDKCHVSIYMHPVRNDREIKMKGISSLIINTNIRENHPIYKPTNEDKNKYKYNEKDGFLNALIEEVVSNGYKNDLCVNSLCTSDEECKCKDFPSLLYEVDEKMNCLRHKRMGEPLGKDHMLALILYTGGDCNYDLSKSQRDGDYMKWKWFDHILYKAICRLTVKEKGCYKLYTGLNGIKLDKHIISNGYFVAYTSASWRKSVATSFVKDRGMIIEIDEQFRNSNRTQCCDVSWISKFGYECEVLIARSVSNLYANEFTLTILNETEEIQTVLLKKVKKSKK